jgi:RNA polymerase sigma-70 factor (ECF subfamily)
MLPPKELPTRCTTRDAAPRADARSEADLMAAIQAADGSALDALIQRYGRLVFHVASDILRDAAEAEDVTQEIFLEIYNRARLYDPARGSVRGWLLQYAYHRSLRRKAALRRRVAYRGEPLDDLDPPDRPCRQVLTREECRWIVRAGLDTLPARQRTTLEMAWLEERSLRDVANHLQVSLGCARHYYYRGLAKLRAWAVIESTDATDATGATVAAAAVPAGPARRTASSAGTAGAARGRRRARLARI